MKLDSEMIDTATKERPHLSYVFSCLDSTLYGSDHGLTAQQHRDKAYVFYDFYLINNQLKGNGEDYYTTFQGICSGIHPTRKGEVCKTDVHWPNFANYKTIR
jgi:hypothetical protein